MRNREEREAMRRPIEPKEPDVVMTLTSPSISRRLFSIHYSHEKHKKSSASAEIVHAPIGARPHPSAPNIFALLSLRIVFFVHDCPMPCDGGVRRSTSSGQERPRPTSYLDSIRVYSRKFAGGKVWTFGCGGSRSRVFVANPVRALAAAPPRRGSSRPSRFLPHPSDLVVEVPLPTARSRLAAQANSFS